MSATKMATECPRWCTNHNAQAGAEDHYGTEIDVPLLGGQLGMQRNVDLVSGNVEEVIYLGDDNLTPAQARELATAVLRLANTLDPRPVPAGLETCAVPMAADMLGLEFSQAIAVAEASYGIEAHR